MWFTVSLLCLAAAASYAVPSPHTSLLDSVNLDHSSPRAESSPVIKNANHIFNAIHSSMRQWGSSLNHNGMSFFLAHIPIGTELYHGRGTREPVQGLEWLAFEPEHALFFARKRLRRPPGDDHDALPGKWKDRGSLLDEMGPGQQKEGAAILVGHATDNPSVHRTNKMSQQHPLDDNEDDGTDSDYISCPRYPHCNESTAGFLHAYAMKYDLRIVYIDGESAAKTDKGTLDSQDYILCGQDDRDGSFAGSQHTETDRGPPGEYTRATGLCNLAANEWKGRVDGFIRMEHGYELILCDFEKSAEPVLITRAGENNPMGANGKLAAMALVEAIAARYHSIGGERVTLNYGNFVTAFATAIDLFHGGQSELPRLNEVSSEERISLIGEITKMVLEEDNQGITASRPVNWQSIADFIVARYSDPLHELAFGESTNITKSSLDLKLVLLLRPFIDFDSRNTSLEIVRCASHFLPKQVTSTIAGRAIFEVSSRVCTTLFSTQQDSQTLETAQRELEELVKWLQWTSWKECRPGCAFGEVCFTAIWPYGDKESHERPYCVKAIEMGKWRDGESYWGGGVMHYSFQ